MGKIIKANKFVVDGEREISDMIGNSEEPQIRVNKRNGIIESIDVVCTCGKVIHIVCEYNSDCDSPE